MTYSKKCHIIKAIKNYYSEKMFLYYLLAGIFLLTEVVCMGVKRRRAYYFFRLFGRVYGSLDFFHTKVLVAPGKLGFYYKGRVPKGIKKYSACAVCGDIETKIVCIAGKKENKPDGKRDEFETSLMRAGGVELITNETQKNKMFSAWLKITQGGKEETIPVELRKRKMTSQIAKLLIQAAAKVAVAARLCSQMA